MKPSLRIKARSDLWCGLLFTAIGLAIVVLAQNYRMGSAARMGPGFFPSMLGGVLAIVGLTIVVPAFFRDGPGLTQFHWRPLILILLGIAAFGLALPSLGFAAAIVALVAVAGFADPDLKPIEIGAVALFLVVFSIAIFVGILGQPLPLWPWS